MRYHDGPLEPYENIRVRRTFDDVGKLVGDRDFKVKLRSTIKAWCIWIGLAATTFTALGTLRGPVSVLLRLIIGGAP